MDIKQLLALLMAKEQPPEQITFPALPAAPAPRMGKPFAPIPPMQAADEMAWDAEPMPTGPLPHPGDPRWPQRAAMDEALSKLPPAIRLAMMRGAK